MQLSSVLKATLPWRGPLIWLLALVAVCFSLAAAVELWRTKTANQSILDLQNGKDIAITARTAPSEVVLARINSLIFHDHLDEAQTLLGSAETNLDPRVRAFALYNMANERTRKSGEFIRKGDLDHAAALINVAKSEYRLALKLYPNDWNTKFNLDVAMRIVRDLPQADNLPDDEQDTSKRIWTDLPGIPKGLP